MTSGTPRTPAAGSGLQLARSLRSQTRSSGGLQVLPSVGTWYHPRRSSVAGLEVQRRVPPRLWCVTRDDVIEFIKCVRKYQDDGCIANSPDPRTGEPNPHHDDPSLGPNIHAVKRHVIAPKTYLAGGMSWALMLHPSGLQEVEEKGMFFVTHNWSEGVYEFENKVVNSWPSEAHGMWCCFLANPQAWKEADLKRLIGENPLRDSPFALAMHHARILVVVPNRAQSIYGRLWCVAEAKMAIDWQIPVRLATNAESCDQTLMRSISQRATSHGGTIRGSCIPDIGSYLRAEEAVKGAAIQLRCEGVRMATCTDADDEVRIREAIRGEEDHIDELISQLRRDGCYPAFESEMPEMDGRFDGVCTGEESYAASYRSKTSKSTLAPEELDELEQEALPMQGQTLRLTCQSPSGVFGDLSLKAN